MDCNKTYQEKFDEDLSKRFKKKYQSCDGDINKFYFERCLFIFDWRSLSTKKESKSSPKMESMTDANNY